MKTIEEFQEILPIDGEYVTPTSANNGPNDNRAEIICFNEHLGILENLINNKDPNFNSDEYFETEIVDPSFIDNINEISAILGNKRKSILEGRENFVSEINQTFDRIYKSETFDSLLADFQRSVFGDFVIEGLETTVSDISSDRDVAAELLYTPYSTSYTKYIVKKSRRGFRTRWFRTPTKITETFYKVPTDASSIATSSAINDIDKLSQIFPNDEYFTNGKIIEFKVKPGKYFSDGYHYIVEDNITLKFPDMYDKYGPGETISSLNFISLGYNEYQEYFGIENDGAHQKYLIADNLNLSVSNGVLKFGDTAITASDFNSITKTTTTGNVDGYDCNIYTIDSIEFAEKFFGRSIDTINTLSGKILLRVDNSDYYASLEGNDTNIVINIENTAMNWYNIYIKTIGDDEISFGYLASSKISGLGFSLNGDILELDRSYLSVLGSDIALVSPTDIKYPVIDALYLSSKFITNSPVYSGTRTYVIGETVIFNGNVYSLIENVLAGVDPSESTNWEYIEPFDETEFENGGLKTPIFNFVRGTSRKDGGNIIYNEPPTIDPTNGILFAKIFRSGNSVPQVRTVDRIEKVEYLEISKLFDRLQTIQYNIIKLSSIYDKTINEEGIQKNLIVYDFGDFSLRDFGLENYFNTNHADIFDGVLEPMVVWQSKSINYNENGILRLDSTPDTSIITQLKWSGSEHINKYGVQTPPFTTMSVSPSSIDWIASTEDIYTAVSNEEYDNPISTSTIGQGDEFLTEVDLQEPSFETTSQLDTTSTTSIDSTNNTWWWNGVDLELTTTTVTTSLKTFYTGVFRLTLLAQYSAVYSDNYSVTLSASQYSFDYNEDIEVYVDEVKVETLTGKLDGSVDSTINLSNYKHRINREYEIKLVGVSSGIEAQSKLTLNAYNKTRFFNTTVVSETLISTETLRWFNVDPIAQTFLVEDDFNLDSIEVVFDIESVSGATLAPGTNFTLPENVLAYITETTAGIPDTKKAIAMTEIKIGTAMNSNSWYTISFENKPRLKSNTVYAIVLMTTAETQGRNSSLFNSDYSSMRIMVRVAEMGKNSLEGSGSIDLINQQPYIDGVLLTSSNSSTWSPSQIFDMAFKVNSCNFSSPKIYSDTKEDLGLTNITDFMFTRIVSENAPSTSSSLSLDIIDTLDNITSYGINEVNSGKYFPASKDIKTLDTTLTLTTEDSSITPLESEKITAYFGTVQEESIYTTRNLELYTDGGYLRISLDVNSDFDPNSVDVYYNTSRVLNSENWTLMPIFTLGYRNNEVIWTDDTFRSYAGLLRLKFILKVDPISPTIRPKLQNLRVYTVNI